MLVGLGVVCWGGSVMVVGRIFVRMDVLCDVGRDDYEGVFVGPW